MITKKNNPPHQALEFRSFLCHISPQEIPNDMFLREVALHLKELYSILVVTHIFPPKREENSSLLFRTSLSFCREKAIDTQASHSSIKADSSSLVEKIHQPSLGMMILKNFLEMHRVFVRTSRVSERDPHLSNAQHHVVSSLTSPSYIRRTSYEMQVQNVQDIHSCYWYDFLKGAFPFLQGTGNGHSAANTSCPPPVPW